MPPDGRTIFTLRGPAWYDDIDFDLKIIRIQAATNIEKATENYFEYVKIILSISNTIIKTYSIIFSALLRRTIKSI